MYYIRIKRHSALHGSIGTHITADLIKHGVSFHSHASRNHTHIMFAVTPESVEVADDIRLIYAEHAKVMEIAEGTQAVAARSIENVWHGFVKLMDTPEFA